MWLYCAVVITAYADLSVRRIYIIFLIPDGIGNLIKDVASQPFSYAYILYLAFEEGSPLNLNSLSTI
jgi:hypothetical protein